MHSNQARDTVMNRFTVLFLFSVCLAVGYAAECQVGETKQEECNSCICTEQGDFACTRKMCLPPHVKVRREISVPDPEEKQCEQGAEWKQGCNRCFCTELGEPVCTRKGCTRMPPAPVDKGSPRSVVTTCQPGTKWMEDCFECLCIEDGTPVCLRMPCKTQERPKRSPKPSGKCTPRAEWMEGDMHCFCSEGGDPYCVPKNS
uniref:Venom pacifastin domain containing protein 1 n=1 Tax=Lethocerus distinctifemur TaxID=280095 RepID=A0A2K8JNQ7_9HEMI|nr:venom pacifastin domain containing protein 1 [Lethocerus distinctifemur]